MVSHGRAARSQHGASVLQVAIAQRLSETTKKTSKRTVAGAAIQSSSSRTTSR